MADQTTTAPAPAERMMPCQDCGKELPARVVGNFIYHGSALDPEKIGTYLCDAFAGEDRKRRAQARAAEAGVPVGPAPYDDVFLARCAISDLIGHHQPESLAEAVRHHGVIGGKDSECEQLQAETWCPEPTPGYLGCDDDRAPFCVLPVHGPEQEHVFVDELGGATA